MTETVAENYAQEVARVRSECEFRTYWLHMRIKGVASEEEAELLRHGVTRRAALRVYELLPHLDPTPKRPEADFTLDYPDGKVTVRLRPLFLYGRYLKFSREIPQSKWPCRWCSGTGCDRCEGTGRRFQRTVEELVAAPLLAVSGATGTKMHSVGREDVDARMIGNGRPFVLELGQPKVRTFDLAPIAAAINQKHKDELEVRQLQFADQALRQRISALNPDKSYRAVVVCLSATEREAVGRLQNLRDLTLAQETPRRVLHRRPNRVRRRILRHCAVELPPDPGPIRRFTIAMHVESGTYIKEFISGDEGRTHPSVAQILGVPCDCAELDVLEVHCDPLTDPALSSGGGNGE